MATCIIDRGDVYSREYNNFADWGYDVDALVSRVAELLADKRPELIWFPDTGEIGVEHTSLSAAQAENPAWEIEELMESLWSRAAAELDAQSSEEENA